MNRANKSCFIPTKFEEAGSKIRSGEALEIIFGGRRRLPLPGRPVPASVNYFKQPAGEKTSCFERWRDSVLTFLSQPLLSIWTVLTICHALLIIGWGAAFFFIGLLDAHLLCEPKDDCNPRNYFSNVAIQILTALFSYSAILTFTWRIANAHHLWLSSRSSAPGCDFYGRKTEAIWFHISRNRRSVIVVMHLLNTFGQVYTQVSRIVYSTYEETQSPRIGYYHCTISFIAAFVLGILSAAMQLWEERKVRQREPERFPPGPLEDAALSYRKWKRGNWSLIPFCCHKAQATISETVMSTPVVSNVVSATAKLASPAVEASAKGVELIFDLPWLLSDLVGGDKVPPNHNDGPSLTIVRAGILPKSHFPTCTRDPMARRRSLSRAAPRRCSLPPQPAALPPLAEPPAAASRPPPPPACCLLPAARRLALRDRLRGMPP